jgi:L-lactate dehydrogenase complex protein LldG
MVAPEQSMSSAREEILDRIRSANSDLPTPPPVPRTYHRRSTLSLAERTDLFAERVAAYRAEVRTVTSDGINPAIQSICRAARVKRIGIPPGLPSAWRPAFFELVEDHGLKAEELDTLGGVITGCTVAIAETGTIVLASSSAEGRRALTLVPDLHICVVSISQIVGSVPDAIAALTPQRTKPLTLISGPSATSDIELSRVEGVHGPRTLHVIVIG